MIRSLKSSRRVDEEARRCAESPCGPSAQAQDGQTEPSIERVLASSLQVEVERPV